MKNPKNALDYDLVLDKTEEEAWEVWTPDKDVGACIGVGKTPLEALSDAKTALRSTADAIAKRISLGDY